MEFGGPGWERGQAWEFPVLSPKPEAAQQVIPGEKIKVQLKRRRSPEPGPGKLNKEEAERLGWVCPTHLVRRKTGSAFRAQPVFCSWKFCVDLYEECGGLFGDPG